MRANLKYFLARLGLIAFASLGLSPVSFAHDLPVANGLADAHAASRTIEQAVVSDAPPNDLIAVAPADVGDAPRPVASTAQPHDPIDVARPEAGAAPRPVLSEAQLSDQLAIARPDAGDAPRPVINVAQATPKSPATISTRASEVYMPYDFQVSDWRFGQFPYHGKTASAPTPTSRPSLGQSAADMLPVETLSEVIPTKSPRTKAAVKFGPPSLQAVALGEVLQQLEQWQCTAYSVLSDGAALARSADRLSHLLGELAMNYRQAYMSAPVSAAVAVAPAAPSIRQPSPTVGPQFVVYDSALGGHIVLTVEDARDWQFDASVTQSRVENALGAALKPIQSSALAAASRQLEIAGRGLLSLSQSLSNIATGSQAETKVASLPSRND